MTPNKVRAAAQDGIAAVLFIVIERLAQRSAKTAQQAEGDDGLASGNKKDRRNPILRGSPDFIKNGYF